MTERGAIERKLFKSGHLQIAGVDEVGRGCLAGPVYAGSCILDYEKVFHLDEKTRSYLRDSKKLTPRIRKEMCVLVKELAKSHGLGSASVEEIEANGIVKATFLAMRRAIEQLTSPIDWLLVDGNKPLPGYQNKQASVINGDNLCYCIAASSIIAKEARDELMRKKAEEYPEYGFENHVGYGTKQHLEAITKKGVTLLHRRNFAPIKKRLSSATSLSG